MVKVPVLLAAATLAAGVLAAIPASATTLSSGPVPLADVPSAGDVQTVAFNGGGHRIIMPNHFGGGRMFGNRFNDGRRFGDRRFDDRRRFVFRDRDDRFRRFNRFNDGFGFALGFGPGYYGYDDYGYGYGDYGYGDYAPGYGVATADDHVRYCLSRYRSYDPATNTFMGYDGYSHPCVGPY